MKTPCFYKPNIYDKKGALKHPYQQEDIGSLPNPLFFVGNRALSEKSSLLGLASNSSSINGCLHSLLVLASLVCVAFLGFLDSMFTGQLLCAKALWQTEENTKKYKASKS